MPQLPAIAAHAHAPKRTTTACVLRMGVVAALASHDADTYVRRVATYALPLHPSVKRGWLARVAFFTTSGNARRVGRERTKPSSPLRYATGTPLLSRPPASSCFERLQRRRPRGDPVEEASRPHCKIALMPGGPRNQGRDAPGLLLLLRSGRARGARVPGGTLSSCVCATLLPHRACA